MMRSMYSAVSGLKTHQTKMDVIGNNIANVNTVAFKSSSVTFQDILYQTTAGASGANAATGLGGVNAKQIGLGVSMASTSVSIETAGAAETTGNPFDIKLTDKNSTNFFVVNDGSQNLFTRSGSFYIDGAGNLCMSSTGYTVMGWQVDPTTNQIRKDTVTALRIMQEKNLTSAPEATTNAVMAGILDENDSDVTSDAGKVLNLNFYDNLGYQYVAKFAVKDTTEDGQYTVELTSILDSNNNDLVAGYNAERMSTLFGSSTLTEKVTNTYNQESLKEGYTLQDDGSIIYNPVYHTETDAAGGVTVTIGTVEYKYDNTTDPDNPVFKADNGNTLNAAAYVYDPVAGTVTDTTNPITYTFDENTIAFNGDDANNSTMTLQEMLGVSDVRMDALNNDEDFSIAFEDGAYVIKEKSATYTLKFDTADGSFDSIDSGDAVTLKLGDAIGAGNVNVNGNFENISIDFTQCLNYNNSGKSTISMDSGATDGSTGKGRKLGNLIGVSVDTNGKIYGSYDNGNTELLGQIAVAQFSNAAGLEKVGESCYQTTLNSGDFDGIGVEISADGSSMTTGQLEMSNVDLSTEFTQMITTQRGFQANSRVITTSDTLLEELVNLKR